MHDMRNKPRRMTEGFLVGGGLLFKGLMLQVTTGPVDWSQLAAPVNYIVMGSLLAIIVAMFLLRRKVRAFEWMMHIQAAFPCLCFAAALTIVMGFTAQTREAGVPWLSQMIRFWPFVLIYGWMALIAGMAALNHLVRFKAREIPFVLNHLGVFLTITCATLGNPDLQRQQLTVFLEEPAVRMQEPGPAVELRRFTADFYENGMPKRFASDVKVHTPDGKCVEGTVEVNRPLKAGGWRIYQYGYDVQRGSDSAYSVLLLVRDPWLPAVYLGFFLMLAGALCLLLLKYRPLRKWILLAAVVLTALFTCLTLARMGHTVQSRPPALQSGWFVPHLIVYMVAYALLGAAALWALYLLLFRRRSVTTEMEIADNLVYAGVAFLTIGMLFGALWAKQAWGHYWSWDPKETWAAVTWLSYLVYLHYRTAKPDKWRTACRMLVFAFICLQFCWWGINYLPSATGRSIHTYNLR